MLKSFILGIYFHFTFGHLFLKFFYYLPFRHWFILFQLSFLTTSLSPINIPSHSLYLSISLSDKHSKSSIEDFPLLHNKFLTSFLISFSKFYFIISPFSFSAHSVAITAYAQQKQANNDSSRSHDILIAVSHYEMLVPGQIYYRI